MAASETERLAEEEVMAQMTCVSLLSMTNMDIRSHCEPDFRTFIFAAMETTSGTLSRVLQLLATHQDMQQKLREELLESRASEGIPYDDLDSLPLLDSICRETLRL